MIVHVPKVRKVNTPPEVIVHTPDVEDVNVTGKLESEDATKAGLVPKLFEPGFAKVIIWLVPAW